MKPPLLLDKPYAVYAQENIVYGLFNNTLNLTCEVEANPPPTIKWNPRNVGDIINESRHKSVLVLNMTEDTPGKYQCTATNELGQFKKEFIVEIGTEPEPPINITLIEAKPTSLEIEIDMPNITIMEETNMEPKWFVIEYRPVRKEEGEWYSKIFNIGSEELLLTDLKKNTKYEIRVATKNLAGLSDYYSTIFETSLAASVHMSSSIFIVIVNLTILLTFRLWMA
ncbi:hypothetical protein NQ314_013712 [Rhamnusium bicolor]|uniref:Uncharacterized protein n=1 Tax=Rhamnusium bicolor TaxID=1586634 RepID=A0AAV8X4M1_9CUCU|nr:hypothetical protein NQ314_013712 [Rhamnusium bicolor]